MDKIQSAYEKAMERFQQRKEVSPLEAARLEYQPIGKALAAKYIQISDYNILEEISGYAGDDRKYVLLGAQETFLGNIVLPVDEHVLEKVRRAISGLLLLKEDKQMAMEAFSQLEQLFNYYEQALVQAYDQFKEDYTAKINAAARSMGVDGQNIDPEKQPGFREEWVRWCSRLNEQYIKVLEEQKDLLRKIP